MQIGWIEHIMRELFPDSSFRTFDATLIFLQILPRLLNLQVNRKLQHSKVYLFSVQQKEIPSRLILGHHVIHSKVCAMKARLTSQKCSVTLSILATWQIVWALIQEIPALVSWNLGNLCVIGYMVRYPKSRLLSLYRFYTKFRAFPFKVKG